MENARCETQVFDEATEILAHALQAVVGATVTLGTIVLLICAAVGCVRWAKRHSTAAQLLAGGMLLVLGFSMPVVKRPQQGVEEAREDQGKKGAQSGDAPDG